MTCKEVLKDELLCEGRRVSLYRRVVRVDGKEFVKDLVKFGESVAIVPLIDRRRVVLLRQWRPAINDWLIEVPAGRIEEGEHPEEAARRELEEEAGYRANTLIRIGSLCVSPGYSDEIIHIYLATDLEFVGASPEEGEVIESVIVPLNEALDFVVSQSRTDMKTVAALALTHKYLQRKSVI